MIVKFIVLAVMIIMTTSVFDIMQFGAIPHSDTIHDQFKNTDAILMAIEIRKDLPTEFAVRALVGINCEILPQTLVQIMLLVTRDEKISMLEPRTRQLIEIATSSFPCSHRTTDVA